MGQKILIKRSAIQGKIPLVSDLDLGEIGLNTYDGKLFIKKNDGTDSIVEIASGGGGGLKALDQGNGVGWTLQSRIDNPDDYGIIGGGAIDFTSSTLPNTNVGATGAFSFAEGYMTTASGVNSHAEGYYTTASGYGAHAEGYRTTASGYGSHAEGEDTTASGYAAHAEGSGTKAYDTNSHAEGSGTKAYGTASHAEGSGTIAYDTNSHTEGFQTKAYGTNSHAEGSGTNAYGTSSHAEGYYTTAQNSYQHSAGKYNIGTNTDTIHETGIGADASNKANAFEIYIDGTLTAPECTNTLITSRGAKALATKEYVDANGLNIQETQFTSTSGQTDFIITGKVFTISECESYTNRLIDYKDEYVVSDDGTDTTIIFNSAKSLNDIVRITTYV